MKRGKKAQFYLIAAGIIVFILISLALVSNYASVKKEPQKFYDIGDVLQREGPSVVAYSVNNEEDVNDNIRKYIDLYKDYLDKNLNTDFDLIIFYGDVTNSNITALRFTRDSLGDLSINFGPTQFGGIGGTEVYVNESEWRVNIGLNTVNVTLTSQRTGENKTIEVPILGENNFAFIMTSNDGFNTYIRDSGLIPSS